MAATKEGCVPVELRERLESCLGSVGVLIKSIRANQLNRTRSPDVDLRVRLVETSQQLSDTCTKLALLFSKPPLPSLSECGGLCDRLEGACLEFVAAYAHLEGGATYREEVKIVVLCVLEDLAKLITIIASQGGTRSAAQLHRTGAVWKSCGDVSKLSRDDRSAVLKVYLSQLQLLRDALSELTQLESRNGVCDESEWDDGMEERQGELETVEWTEEELQIIRPASQLIKVCVEVVECASRLLVTGGGDGGVADMDAGCALIKQLSPAIDDLANEMEAPVAMETCRSLALKVSEVLLSCVHSLSSHSYCQANGWPRDHFIASIDSYTQLLTVNLYLAGMHL
ncbi:cyclin-D1-binding protein 1 homolog [Halichondria panicea]|uniref:cyclin-D1-binding protein 1 homolog n=1 Tax=Halichondria panicea TaxID=6063 RepID=UPI00312B3EA0